VRKSQVSKNTHGRLGERQGKPCRKVYSEIPAPLYKPGHVYLAQTFIVEYALSTPRFVFVCGA
jgi:hypothetical protein